MSGIDPVREVLQHAALGEEPDKDFLAHAIPDGTDDAEKWRVELARAADAVLAVRDTGHRAIARRKADELAQDLMQRLPQRPRARRHEDITDPAELARLIDTRV